MTGPGPPIPRTWWTGSSPTVPVPMSWTSAAAPALPPGNSRRPGCRVLGVDVDARMADLARRSGLQVEVATFEAWDPVGRAFDAVIAGQAWHWVDPVAGAAKAAAGATARWPAGRVLERGPSAVRSGGSLRRCLPPGHAGLAVHPLGEARLGRVRGVVHQGSRRHPRGERVRRPGAVAIRLGAALRPGRVARPASYAWRSTKLPPASWKRCWRAPGPPSTRWAAASRCVTPRWWSPRYEPVPPDPGPSPAGIGHRSREARPACQGRHAWPGSIHSGRGLSDDISPTRLVEVAGIEPASFSTSPGLLRAQPASFFSAPAILQASRRRAQPLFDVPSSPAAGPDGGSS